MGFQHNYNAEVRGDDKRSGDRTGMRKGLSTIGLSLPEASSLRPACQAACYPAESGAFWNCVGFQYQKFTTKLRDDKTHRDCKGMRESAGDYGR